MDPITTLFSENMGMQLSSRQCATLMIKGDKILQEDRLQLMNRKTLRQLALEEGFMEASNYYVVKLKGTVALM